MVKVSGKSSSPLPGRPRVDELDGIAKGDLISIKDEPGRFKVMSIALNDDGSCAWVDAFGGEGYPSRSEEVYVGWRAFSLDRIVGMDQPGGTPAIIEHGRRDSGLLADLQHELARSGTSSRPAPDDPKAEKSLRERYYTAARKLGMKVKVKLIDGMIVAKIKEESA